MNRQEIDVLVKQMNVDTATGPCLTNVYSKLWSVYWANSFQAIEDLDITQTELDGKV